MLGQGRLSKCEIIPPWCVVYFPHSKWKADRGAVTSLCVSPDGKLLLSAGQTIKMWDLDTKEVYRVSVHIWDGVTWYEEIVADRALSSDACLRLNVTPYCRNSQVTLQLWRPCASPLHDLLTATVSIFCPGRHTIDCLVFGECWRDRRPSFGHRRHSLAFSLFTDLHSPHTGKCERMERTRIQWCHLHWLTSHNTSTSSRLRVGRRWEWRNTVTEEFVTKGWVRKHLNISKNEIKIINRSCNGFIFFNAQNTRSQQPIPYCSEYHLNLPHKAAESISNLQYYEMEFENGVTNGGDSFSGATY